PWGREKIFGDRPKSEKQLPRGEEQDVKCGDVESRPLFRGPIHLATPSPSSAMIRLVNSASFGSEISRGRGKSILISALIFPGRPVKTTTRSPRHAASFGSWVTERMVF